MSGNRYSQLDHTNTVVTVGMLLLALLGVVTVFHEPIAAVLIPTAATETHAPLPSDDHRAPARPQ